MRFIGYVFVILVLMAMLFVPAVDCGQGNRQIYNLARSLTEHISTNLSLATIIKRLHWSFSYRLLTLEMSRKDIGP
jgi:hypothetical protein